MNIAPIYDNEGDSPKNPGIDISKWHTEKQAITDVMNFDWNKAIGVGLITGYNGYRAIDIDGIIEENLLEEIGKEKLIGKILTQLGLPEDYPWVVKSGSGKGCHIIFQSDDVEDMHRGNFAFAPLDSRKILDYGFITTDFKRMEISWRYFLVLPPSCLKGSSSGYNFWYNDLPSSKPEYISNEKLANVIYLWCGFACDEEWIYNDSKFKIYYRECNTTLDSARIKGAAEKKEYAGLLKACDEGRNSLAFSHSDFRTKLHISVDLLSKSNCVNARLNLVNLMAVGYIVVSINEFFRSLKGLLNDGIIEDWEYENFRKIGLKNCKQPNRLMFFDTETNGLPPKYIFQLTDMPRIVQLSWIVADADGNIEKKCGYIIKPTDFDIPEDAVKVHGISKERALKEGMGAREVLSLFMSDLRDCNAIVGHNVSFDIQVLRGELERHKIENAIIDMPSYCTMRLSVDYCKIPTEAAYIRSFSQYLSYSLSHPREYKYKYPKLIELYDFLFDDRFDNAHDANADVEATVKCFFELIKRKVISYKSTDRTYGEIISVKDRTTNILNDNLLSCIEKWQLSKNGDKWLAKAILKKDRIIKVSLLYKLSNDGVQMDTLSLPLIESYGLALCECFSINADSIAVSKMQLARIIPDDCAFMISEVHWAKNEGNKWRTKLVRSFSIEEQKSVENTKIVASQYGNSVCFKLKSGREVFIPLSIHSSLRVGEDINLSKCKLICLFNGGEEILRVLE